VLLLMLEYELLEEEVGKLILKLLSIVMIISGIFEEEAVRKTGLVDQTPVLGQLGSPVLFHDGFTVGQLPPGLPQVFVLLGPIAGGASSCLRNSLAMSPTPELRVQVLAKVRSL
jgi:hypothetical protein